MSRAEDNYDSSIFYFRGINETYEGKKTRKILELIEELNELMQEFGTKQYFVEFIGDIHDNELLDEFRDAIDLKSKFFEKVREFRSARAAARAAAAAPVAHAAAAAAPHANQRTSIRCSDCRYPEQCDRCKADERSHKSRSRGGKKKSHKKSHKKGGKKSHKKRTHRRRH